MSFFGLFPSTPAYVGAGQPLAGSTSAGFFSWFMPEAPRYVSAPVLVPPPTPVPAPSPAPTPAPA